MDAKSQCSRKATSHPKLAFAPMSGWGMRGKLNDNKLKQIYQINDGTLSRRHENIRQMQNIRL
jgi:hypothetical protein